MKLNEELLKSDIVRRLRDKLEQDFMGQPMSVLDTTPGRQRTWLLAYFWGAEYGDASTLSVVFTSDSDKLIYWIGPTSALPPNAKTHATITP
jgi:hypothetical protein